MRLYKKQLFLGLASLIIGLAIFSLRGGEASAATLTVSSGCTLSEAIQAINGAQDENGCTNSAGDSYGANDVITLPTGTITLSADLPQITASTDLKVSGAGKTQTIIDADGHSGFNSTDQPEAQRKFEKFKIQNASNRAFALGKSKLATFDQLEVANSTAGLMVLAETISVTNSYIHDNVDTSNTRVGLDLSTFSSNPSATPSINVTDTKVNGNSGVQCSGIYIHVNQDEAAGLELILVRTTVMNNIGLHSSGVQVNYQDNDALADVKIDAVTVANNETHPTTAGAENIFDPAYISGFILGVSNLKPQLNLTNVTVAYNKSINTVDNHVTIAGFFGLLIDPPEKINLTNSTVVGNEAVQSISGPFGSYAAFFLVAPILNGAQTPSSIISGGSAQNSLIAGNTFNGQNGSCQPAIDGSAFGLGQTYDLTPINLGNNLSDDTKCTGYRHIANLYDTIDHEVKDNGGPVPTVAIHDDSPAVNAGGQVLGITTDARGVARTGYVSVGAYQGRLLAASTNTTTTGTLAKTGIAVVSASAVGVVLLVVMAYTYFDYRRHRKPLVEADPFARQTYTYGHHISTVTLPLLKYRVHISFSRNPSGISKF